MISSSIFNFKFLNFCHLINFAYLRVKNNMIINQSQAKIIEAALLEASDYIADNIEAICDDDYLEISENVLSKVNDALDIFHCFKDRELQ